MVFTPMLSFISFDDFYKNYIVENNIFIENMVCFLMNSEIYINGYVVILTLLAITLRIKYTTQVE